MHRVVTPMFPAELTSWAPPTWTEEVNTDGDMIECSRTLGMVPHCVGAGEGFSVRLVQRDEVRATSDRIGVVRHPAAVVIDGVGLAPADADALATLLTGATALVRSEAATTTGTGPARTH